MTGKFNKELEKSDWNTKLYGDGKPRTQSILGKPENADLHINRELRKYSQWTEEEIKARTDRFISDFFKIWKFDKDSE